MASSCIAPGTTKISSYTDKAVFSQFPNKSPQIKLLEKNGDAEIEVSQVLLQKNIFTGHHFLK